jgi:hypothetical protein
MSRAASLPRTNDTEAGFSRSRSAWMAAIVAVMVAIAPVLCR